MTEALWVTFLGMGITFGAIVLLWGLMALLTAIPVKIDSPQPVEVGEDLLPAKAAAAAVAVALAEQRLSTARPLAQPQTAIVSAWQLGMRSRQMYEKGKR